MGNSPQVERVDFRVKSAREGYEVLLRNKDAITNKAGIDQNPILFVHGATYGSTDTFDYKIGDYSWMDMLAQHGFDVWCLDILGYGRSDRPKEMGEAPENNPPLSDTEYAVSEIHKAVSFILDRRNCKQVDLIGYSWGTATCGSYAGRYPELVGRLFLSGALWIEEGSSSPVKDLIPAEIGAYRTVTVDAMMKRWATGLDDKSIDSIVSESDRRDWCICTAGCDPDFETNGFLRAPTGVVKDFAAFSQSGDAWYDPGLIRCPVQIAVGELDQETTPLQGQQVFAKLVNAKSKQLTVIGQGTHSLLLENNRHQLHKLSLDFLNSTA